VACNLASANLPTMGGDGPICAIARLPAIVPLPRAGEGRAVTAARGRSRNSEPKAARQSPAEITIARPYSIKQRPCLRGRCRGTDHKSNTSSSGTRGAKPSVGPGRFGLSIIRIQDLPSMQDTTNAKEDK
jgi:hypothetical protein